MKLNFWQWIGLVVFIVCVVYLIYRETRPLPTAPAPTPAPAVTYAPSPSVFSIG